MFTSAASHKKKPLWEKKTFIDIPKALGQSFPTHSHCVLQISIPTYIHTFLVLSPICHRNNKLNVQSLNTRNKNLWIAGDLRICSVTDEKKKSFVKKLKCVFIQSSSIHTHTYTHALLNVNITQSTTYRYNLYR